MSGDLRTFYQILINTLLVSVINFTVWFAVTFWVYLETRSVFATGVISGIFLVLTALTGIWFGSLVDHHRRTLMMQFSAGASFVLYLAALGVWAATPPEAFQDPASVRLWAFVVLLMTGVIAGNIRTIALPTLVTILIDEDGRDRANGLVGTTSGVTMLTTSVISGLLVATDGMRSVLIVSLVVLALSIVHLGLVTVREPAPSPEHAAEGGRVDLGGTIRLVRGVPGLMALVFFSAFNNLLGGVFMALMDAYGLSLVSVQAWGVLWGVLSTGFIVGGLLIAKVGLGGRPVRLLLLVNLVLWTVVLLFPLKSSIIPLAVGMYAYMLLVPFAEAAEQTILQRVVPLERQGRVFGFAQSVEQAASPATAFLISPITQFVFIPLMTDGAGARTIGSWFGTGADRGIALVFVLTGALGIIATIIMLNSRPYRRLSARYAAAPAETPETPGAGAVAPDPVTVKAGAAGPILAPGATGSGGEGGTDGAGPETRG
ncbi:MFS transporter [Catenuloplanes japonicus]|uniref:MFS transporter n=1 Tax=Catenuloplanes japonicus TaxID=33876 RepID=UPI0007C534CF|nr:MFS transporter [Catenuloplanes japonicus]